MKDQFLLWTALVVNVRSKESGVRIQNPEGKTKCMSSFFYLLAFGSWLLNSLCLVLTVR